MFQLYKPMPVATSRVKVKTLTPSNDDQMYVLLLW